MDLVFKQVGQPHYIIADDMLENQSQGTCQHDRTSYKLFQFKEMAKQINKKESQS
jgi:hypothetical protein